MLPLPFFSDGTYVVLGGQHVSTALIRRRDALVSQGLPVPPQIAAVRAAVLPATTSLEMRRKAAGDHNANQANLQTLRLSEVAGCLLRAWEGKVPEGQHPHTIAALVLAGLVAAGCPPSKAAPTPEALQGKADALREAEVLHI